MSSRLSYRGEAPSATDRSGSGRGACCGRSDGWYHMSVRQSFEQPPRRASAAATASERRRLPGTADLPGPFGRGASAPRAAGRRPRRRRRRGPRRTRAPPGTTRRVRRASSRSTTASRFVSDPTSTDTSKITITNGGTETMGLPPVTSGHASEVPTVSATPTTMPERARPGSVMRSMALRGRPRAATTSGNGAGIAARTREALRAQRADRARRGGRVREGAEDAALSHGGPPRTRRPAGAPRAARPPSARRSRPAAGASSPTRKRKKNQPNAPNVMAHSTQVGV